MGFTSLASEFPNDNAQISAGAIWVGAKLTGPSTLELAPFTPVPAQAFVLFFDDDDVFADGPVELELCQGQLSVAVHPESPVAASEPADVTLLRPAHTPQLTDAVETGAEMPDVADPPPAFRHFETALADALMAKGASRSAALLPRLLRLESLPPDALAKDVLLTLQSRGYLDGNARYSFKFRELCGAWSAVLQGSSRDFAACGTTTLDRFGAELLAALLAVPATRADELRRELRKAGIAAFGVLEAA